MSDQEVRDALDITGYPAGIPTAVVILALLRKIDGLEARIAELEDHVRRA